METTAIQLFSLFCLVYGVFGMLYYAVRAVQRASANIFGVLLVLAALTWGLYSVAGVEA